MKELPKKDRKWDVFISYNGGDIEEGLEVYRILKQAGWKPFIAHKDLNEQVGTASWSEKVDEALDESGALVLIVTPNALDSKWVTYEWRTVHTDILARKPGMIIPCCLRGPRPDELPRALRRYQSVDFRNGVGPENKGQLLALIEGYLQKPIEHEKSRPISRILSIDGGGNLGLISLSVLKQLEGKLDQRAGAETYISDHFDLIAGASVGSMIACLLRLPMRVDQVIDLFHQFSGKIFRKAGAYRMFLKGVRYKEDYLRSLVDDLFEDIELKDLKGPCLFPAYDVCKGELRNFSQHAAVDFPDENFKVKDALMASLAAPTYFPAAMVQPVNGGVTEELIDGGVVVNCPARLAFEEVKNHFPYRPLTDEIFLLSLGNISKPPVGTTKNFGLPQWIAATLDITMSGAEHQVHEHLEGAFDTANARDQYIRIEASPKGESFVPKFDDTSSKAFSFLMGKGAQLAEHHKRDLDFFADYLVQGKDMTEEPEVEVKPEKLDPAERAALT